ncbi:hypothetical protein C943_02613 [Mariniradius saccharolyticus AK6]|uniref:Outer membrane protein beta-barrel domain-containing protein n=1 Tax=Mariniradius saccharolyticus AK6 TaxID=1239962 RepID=M7X0J2_9BACT|nr:porin family protein [Mariniradius saccharolyticus]EMS31040.1 hypothetical protein C943_02613 [Mariniradius saccharolyticus AK6]
MKYLSTLLLVLFSWSLQAQDFSIGPKVGFSQANVAVNGDGFSTGDAKFGYHLGAFVRMGGHSIFVQPELLFTNTGGTVVKSGQGTNETYSASFNRLDIPLMFGFKLAKVFRVQAGPVASVLMNYKIEDSVDAVVDADYSSATVGYQAGIGLDVGNVILDFKYESSLSKLSKGVAGFETDTRQNQLILSAGFRLF